MSAHEGLTHHADLRNPCSRSRGLSVRYGKHLALDGVSLSVRPGEIVVMLGANGAGKSSCLKALGGMVARMPGARIALGGVDLTHLPAHEIVEAGLALVPEDRGIFADLSVHENLLLGAYLAPRAPARGRQPEEGAGPVSAPRRAPCASSPAP